MKTIDKVARFWDKQPCNSRDSEKLQATTAYFAETETKKYLAEPHILRFADFEQWRGKKVLEIGTGIGTDAVNFARAEADYTGVDLSPKSLDLCRKRFAANRLPGSFYLGNAEDLSSLVPIKPYDLIYSFGVIHHTPHPGRIIDELKKYCSPETEIRIMLYAKWSWKVLRIILVHGQWMFWRARDLVARYGEAQIGCPVTHLYSFREIRKLLKDFKIVEIHKRDLALCNGLVKWLILNLPRFCRYWLERWFGWNILIVAKPLCK